MKLEDFSQNLPIRIGTIQIIAFLFLSVLGARLYYLQIVKGEYYTKKAENQQLRVIRIPARRGAIFDRNGKLLVDSHSIYNIALSRQPIKDVNPNERLDEYAEGLGVDKQFLVERLNWLKKQPEYETMVIKENATMSDIIWVESHQLEYPELSVEKNSQRFYPNGTTAAHVLGYVGEISPKQLENPDYQEKNFRPGDVIGKGGLEQFYDEQLRGLSGYRRVLVDSRGRVQTELETVQPQAGQDLITTIDIDLQIAAEEQLAKSATKRGTIVVMDPNNGELLAMASAPTFDPNDFVSRISSREGRAKIAEYYTNPDRPLLNRAIQGRYPPGSTWKIPEAAAAMVQGVITPENNAVYCGGGITIGSKHTRCMGSHGTPPLRYAITKSCDGYFYRLALEMKLEGLIKMAEMFEYDKLTGVDLPNEKQTRTPKYYAPIKMKNYPYRWLDIETVFASIGQVTVEATPISMLRAVSSISVGGKMYTPHLLKEFKEVGAVGLDPNDTQTYRPAKPAFGFDHPEPKIIPITPEQNKVITDGMWGVVNNGGTASRIAMSNFSISGKTGTAQVAALGQDVGHKKDHAWFVSYAPSEKPEIAVIVLIENSGFGANNAGPAARGVYEAYLAKRGQVQQNGDAPQVAMK